MGRTKNNGNAGRQRKPAQPKQRRLDELLTPRRSERNAKKVDKDLVTKGEDNELIIKLGKPQTIALVDKSGEKEKREVLANSRGGKIKGRIELSVEEQRDVLKNFDLNHTFGPCRGISRRDRYNRALQFKIMPAPEELIPMILQEHQEDFTFQKCIWDQNELLKLHV